MTNLRLEHGDNVLSAYLAGEIDHHSAGLLRSKIDSAVQIATPDILIMDFNGITFMDSSGVGLILGRHKLISILGGKLIVQGVPMHVHKLLNLAGIKCEYEENKK